MKLIFCIDNKGGMMFNNRRQSQDRFLRSRMLSIIENRKLVMTPYSAKQFVEDGNIAISTSPQADLYKNEYYFVEDGDFSLNNVDEIIIYRWNRVYPADKYFGINLCDNGFVLHYTYEFEGSSHDKITEERYKRR